MPEEEDINVDESDEETESDDDDDNIVCIFIVASLDFSCKKKLCSTQTTHNFFDFFPFQVIDESAAVSGNETFKDEL